MSVHAPVCTIIAGPNGAGKTTFALQYLPDTTHSQNFVNADMIAAALSPQHPEKEWLVAGRLFLGEVHSLIHQRVDFAFETTLSGRSYMRLVRNLVHDGWHVHLCFLWLPSIEACVARVAERVSTGGHFIPLDTISRRYPRGIANLLHEYAPICTATVCFDNSGREPVVIFRQDASGRSVLDTDRYARMMKVAEQ